MIPISYPDNASPAITAMIDQLNRSLLSVQGNNSPTVVSSNRSPVFDQTIQQATRKVSMAGLNGSYDFEFIIFNPSGSTGGYKMYYNNDSTDTNYYSAKTGSAGANTPYLYNGDAGTGMGTGSEVRITGTCIISPAGYVTSYMNYVETANVGGAYWHRYTIKLTHFNQLDVVATVENGIGVNSRFRLWSR